PQRHRRTPGFFRHAAPPPLYTLSLHAALPIFGNRSILADPRRAEMKDIINARVKHREPFRPFAPAVLLEHASEFFHLDQPDPFRSEEHTSELQSRENLVCRLLLEHKKRPA